MNQKIKVIIVREDLDQSRVDSALAESSDLSRTQIQRLIQEGKILKDGSPIQRSDKASLNSEYEILLEEPKISEVRPENIALEILFEDEHLLIVNKPQGMSVHPSDAEFSGTLVNAILYHVKDLSGIGGVLRPGIVHRIDKFTSGALVVCKNDRTHQKLSELFSKHDIQRSYLALCYGSPDWTKQTLKSKIGRNPKDRKKMAVLSGAEGRTAISHFEKLESFSSSRRSFGALVRATLETGRTHQVRVHLNHLGHSIFGDPVYGVPSTNQDKWKIIPPEIRTSISDLPGQALHAAILGFRHPITGESIYVEAPAPKNFEALVQKLQEYRS